MRLESGTEFGGDFGAGLRPADVALRSRVWTRLRLPLRLVCRGRLGLFLPLALL
jgi:hypothetical protein